MTQQIRCPIVGSRFRSPAGIAALGALRKGDQVTLIRDPDNAHDRWAVEVWARGEQIGYLPRTINTGVAQHLDRLGVRERTFTGTVYAEAIVEKGEPRFAAKIEIVLP